MLRRALPLALLLCAACASTRDDRARVERIDTLIARQDFEVAVREAEEWRARAPGDPRAEEAHRRASVAFLLEQARRATFAGDPERALVLVEQAAEIGPDFPPVVAWQVKTRSTLARRWYERGLDLHARDNLDAAALAYQRALFYEPSSLPAARSLAQIGLQREHRFELGQDYYHEGVSSLAAFWLERARSRFSYAHKYLRDERPARRTRQVDRLLAEQRLEVAHTLEGQGLYAAAANEFRLALLLDPELEGAQEGRERNQREAVAAQRLMLAEMDMLRGEHGRALERLAEGDELTELQAERVEDMRERIGQGRLEVLYQQARVRERDFQYEEAIEGYDRLLEETDYFQDARARRDTLAGYVRQAEVLWEHAMATEDPADRLAILLQIEVFWPEYRDLPERLEALRRESSP